MSKESQMSAQGVRAKVGALESLCSKDVGRGIAPLSARATGGLAGAAQSLAHHPQPHVAVITGFYIPSAQVPAPETDGPVGAAHLAAGLVRAGIPVRMVSDDNCMPAIEAALSATDVHDMMSYDQIPVTPGTAQNDHLAETLTQWRTWDPPVSHVISIERPGPTLDGTYRNMRGVDISAHTAPLEKLFTAPGCISIGIGDGGNELGMGAIPAPVIHKAIANGDSIACVTGCDHLIVAGVSNWGATALLVAMALIKPDLRNTLLARLTVEQELLILTQLVTTGPAVDGVTGKQDLSVDGLPFAYHADVLKQMMAMVRA